MIVEIPPNSRQKLRPIFSQFHGLEGCVEAGLSGEFGTAFADSAMKPHVALLNLAYDRFLAGDVQTDAAEMLVRDVLTRPAGIVVPDDQWESLLRATWGDAVASYRRVHFRPGHWQRRKLAQFIRALPQGFQVRRVGRADLGRFVQLSSTFVLNYPSDDAFLERGVGYGVEHAGHFVAGCSSFTLAGGKLEFEIYTAPDFRRRGLAAAAAAAMIIHCVDNDLLACWDAANVESARLAAKLGFKDGRPYTAFHLS